MGAEGADIRIPAQVFGQERRAEVMEEGLLGPEERLEADIIADPAVRGSPSCPVDHGLIPHLPEPGQEAAEMAA
jgi:hypothetical protein